MSRPRNGVTMLAIGTVFAVVVLGIIVATRLGVLGMVVVAGDGGGDMHADARHTLPGSCEASSIVRSEQGFVVADNEAENYLITYDAAFYPTGRMPLPGPVEDIEALVPTPTGMLVMGSQSRNKKGKRRPGREVVLDLERGLISQVDLSACAPCVRAGASAPKAGGVNIEGGAWWRSSLWLGARSPLDGGQALLLRMHQTAPSALRVAEVLPVDLGGMGIRELRERDGVLWLLAGPTGASDLPHHLYRLHEPGGQPKRIDVQLPPGSEGFAWSTGGSLFVVTDGDGQAGEPCKAPATWQHIRLP